MAIISLQELLDIAVMTIVVGVIFSDVFRKFRHPYEFYGKPSFDWQGLKFAMMVTAPAIILHEFAHKFVALGFGFQAVFKAAYGWLAFGLVLKLMNVGFIFFVPAYVSITDPSGAGIAPLAHSLIAFGGPCINLILWVAAMLVLNKNLVKKRYIPFVYLTKQINMFLFIFNMLPIPGFDGFSVYQGLFQTVF